ncbi:MAG: class I SAM-dependent methyltransferase [Planctomycetota bacterium]|jgi:ubiquinone/menaquinone biosynthesis C-methylase UbiE|nr:class I SAM-dependent methyltransferase [Planctomycetota bacterium]
MKLNAFEYALLTSSGRRFVQGHFDFRQWHKLGMAPMQGGRVLDVGCGQGHAAEIAISKYSAAAVDAVDPDDRMLNKSKKRLDKFSDKARCQIASATSLPFETECFDTVIVSQVLHHVDDWQRAIVEVVRVMKPKSQLLVVESLAGFINNPLLKKLMKHPSENRFYQRQLLNVLSESGLCVKNSSSMFGCFCWVVATKN